MPHKVDTTKDMADLVILSNNVLARIIKQYAKRYLQKTMSKIYRRNYVLQRFALKF